MKTKPILSMLLTLGLLAGLCPAVFAAESTETVHTLELSSRENGDGSWSHSAVYDGGAVAEYDYTWNVDPSEAHDEVKNMPAVYYTGTEPGGDEAVYIAHDVYYYPELDEDSFVRQNYDGETEWCYYYTADGYTDYVFSTLPVQGNGVPTDMMHSADEAYENAVLHITEAGTYSITGDWHGQIWIDLGEDAFDDPDAKVTVILNGVDVACTVAPALVFANVYECDNTWEEQESWSSDVDTSEAGASVILADGTVNNFSGTNIYRILKAAFKEDDAAAFTGAAQKKYLKIDGAFYSYMSMNIDGQTDGTGILNVTSGFEGLDTELHLTLNGGNVNINAQNDGINVNEDGVSVATVNGGSLHIVSGLGAEGDGIDSNGFLVINGGTVISCANPASDSGLDSDKGSYINGGYVVATGSTMDWAESDSEQVTMNLQFSSAQGSDEAIIVTDLNGTVLFAYDPDQDETTGAYNRSYRGAVISSPAFQVGERYYVYVGGDVYGTDVNGLYDVSTVTGFSSEAVQQCYTGTDVGMGGPGGGRPGGGMGGGMQLDGVTDNGDGTISVTADGAASILEMLQQRDESTEVTAEQLMACATYQELMELIGSGGMGGGPGFDGGTPPDRPEDGGRLQDGGFQPGEMDGTPPADAMPPDGDGASQGGNQDGTADAVFRMADKVNSFSGVTDFTGYTGFTDVASNAYYSEAVAWAVKQGITSGTSDTAFSPNVTCTRAQAMTFLWRAAGSPEPAGSGSPFTDVASDAYYYKAVLWAVEQGITSGTTETTFRPDDAVSRSQTVTFLYRAAGSPSAAGSSFTDVAADAYYADAVAWAVSEGITAGTSDTAFAPDTVCTRAQIVTFLWRDMAE